VARPESKLYADLKKISPQIKWTRLENWAVFGTPDLLGYHPGGFFFTLELKVTKRQSSPEPSSGGVAYESPNKHLCACALHIYKK
jgi:hypothetical protein